MSNGQSGEVVVGGPLGAALSWSCAPSIRRCDAQASSNAGSGAQLQPSKSRNALSEIRVVAHRDGSQLIMSRQFGIGDETVLSCALHHLGKTLLEVGLRRLHARLLRAVSKLDIDTMFGVTEVDQPVHACRQFPVVASVPVGSMTPHSRDGTPLALTSRTVVTDIPPARRQSTVAFTDAA